jgi:hypothetical protein
MSASKEDQLYAAIQAILHSNRSKGTADTEIKRQLSQRYPAVLRANRDQLLRLGINAFIEQRHRRAFGRPPLLSERTDHDLDIQRN